MPLVPLPLYLGMSEQADPRMFPEPGVTLLRNARMRKLGRVGKRYGHTSVSNALLPLVAAGKFPSAVVDHYGKSALVVGDVVQLRHGTGLNDWRRVTKVSRFMPVRGFPVTRSEEAALVQPTVAVSNGKVLYFHSHNNATPRLWFMFATTSGVVLNRNQLGNGSMPRAVNVGANAVRVVYRDGTSVRQSNYDTTTPVPTSAGSGVVGTLSSVTGLVDAAPLDATNHLVVWQSAALAFTVAIVNSSAGIVFSQTIATTNAPTAVSVVGTPAESVFVAWVESNGAVRYSAFASGNLTPLVAGTTIETFSGAESHQPNMIRMSPTSVAVVYGAYVTTSGGYGVTSYVIVNNGSGVGTISRIYNCRPASKPFDVYGTLINLLVQTDNSGPSDTNAQWDQNRGYYALMIEPGSPTYALTMTAAPLIPSDQTLLIQHLPDVAGDASGYYAALTTVLRQAAFAVELTGVQALTFSSSSMSLREAFRANARAFPATLFAGGLLVDFHGYHGLESGLAHAPAINSAALSGGGNLSAGVYSYLVVYEWLDNAGRRWRSAPSEPVQVTAALNDRVTLTIATYAFNGDWIDRYGSQAGAIVGPSRVTAHVYRTKAGQPGKYYRVTPNIGAPDGAPYAVHAPTVTYLDSLADSALTSEFVYTDGGVLPNTLPPACRFVVNVRGRIVIGGLFDVTRAIASKLIVNGEPVQFTDSPAFEIVIPEPITGIAGLDEAIVLFSEDSIYMVYGDGPNDQGIGAYPPPRRLPSHVGCVDHRSIVETPSGLMFQSKHGIYLLPRGFGQPVFVGADVQSTFSQFPIVQSAVLCLERGNGAPQLPEASVRFVVGNAETPSACRVLAYDLKAQAWSIDEFNDVLGVAGKWNDFFAFALSDLTQTNPVREESYSEWGDRSAYTPSGIRTAELTPFLLAGLGRVNSIIVAGEARTSSSIEVRIVVTTGDGEVVGDQTYAITEAAGRVWHRQLVLRHQAVTSLVISVDDQSFDPSSEGVVYHGIYLDVEPEEGPLRLPDAKR